MIKRFILPLLFFGISLAILLVAFPPMKDQLAVYNPIDFNPELVDKDLHNWKKNHTIGDFKLINQNGKTITQQAYRDKIYVADFFFTSCPSICPIMTDNMVKIQNEFLNNDKMMLLSLSVTPNRDSIPILREYADKKGVLDTKWNITTGDKKHIYELARKSFFAVTDIGDGGLQDFIHTTNFILVDTKKQIRGIYNGIDEKEVLRLIKDIKSLLN
ncbi:SCO family protein [Arenibacter sp. ARW7G5Y1]|uniref:SCO family protein n=1 Tax=Arenibacter sp. ARW7G5Y1 TaxID=2135619 RepID=UPI000D774792|nr:SCO family protein [Arenibacter sp. ARW7G5Y1]PXX27367.1 protein SCO1/2 [Arenibacter sp. ARW7G5Y1]